jgi:hypothetical protein
MREFEVLFRPTKVLRALSEAMAARIGPQMEVLKEQRAGLIPA